MAKIQVPIPDDKLDNNLKKSIKDFLAENQPKGGIVFIEEFAINDELTEKVIKGLKKQKQNETKEKFQKA
jgi:ABC-type amino acid transport substrate-binding protein